MDNAEMMSNDELLKLKEDLNTEFLAKRKHMGDTWRRILELGRQYKEIEGVLKKRGVIDG